MRRIKERYILSGSIETRKEHNAAKEAIIKECGCNERDILIEVNCGLVYVMEGDMK